MRHLHLALTLLLVTYLCGCELLDGSTDADSTFTLDKTVYVAGEQAVLTLKNNSFREVGFNLSCSILEPQEGQSLPAEVRETACDHYLGTLAAGKETSLRYRLHLDLPGGVYRFSTRVHGGKELDEARTMFSNSFAARK